MTRVLSSVLVATLALPAPAARGGAAAENGGPGPRRRAGGGEGRPLLRDRPRGRGPAHRRLRGASPASRGRVPRADRERAHERFLREAAAGKVAADVLWSPAMDSQIKLANDGFAAAYDSPEASGLPAWAVWRSEAFGTTLEPLVFVHDERTLPSAQAPQSHAESREAPRGAAGPLPRDDEHLRPRAERRRLPPPHPGQPHRSELHRHRALLRARRDEAPHLVERDDRRDPRREGAPRSQRDSAPTRSRPGAARRT